MPQNVAMIGDDVSADLGQGAIEMGFYRYLGEDDRFINWRAPCCLSVILTFIVTVKTGKYKEGDEDKLASSGEAIEEKSKLFDSIVEVIDHVLQYNA